MAELLPLFPLDLVLFPGTALPLHIFEPRYKEMIGECIEQSAPFGIVRASDDAVAEVGCTAEILEVTKRYDDGRLDILTEGQSRFRVLSLNQERAFLRGEVSFLEDEPSAPAPEQSQRALDLYGELLEMAGTERPEGSEEAADHPLLSFQLAAPLPLDLDFKQALLALRSEAERVEAVIKYYEQLVPRMRRTMTARKRAGGNGRVG